MRKRTGLRNRSRSGRSTYSVLNKNRTADRYSPMTNGKPNGTDLIAGRSLLAIQKGK